MCRLEREAGVHPNLLSAAVAARRAGRAHAVLVGWSGEEGANRRADVLPIVLVLQVLAPEADRSLAAGRGPSDHRAHIVELRPTEPGFQAVERRKTPSRRVAGERAAVVEIGAQRDGRAAGEVEVVLAEEQVGLGEPAVKAADVRTHDLARQWIKAPVDNRSPNGRLLSFGTV